MALTLRQLVEVTAFSVLDFSLLYLLLQYGRWQRGGGAVTLYES